jgi:hypothetical protein
MLQEIESTQKRVTHAEKDVLAVGVALRRGADFKMAGGRLKCARLRSVSNQGAL